MKNSNISMLFVLCALIHIGGIVCGFHSKMFLLLLSLFFFVCCLFFLVVEEEEEEEEEDIETFKKSSKKSSKKSNKKEKEKENEMLVAAILQKSTNALSTAESPGSSVDDIKKAVAECVSAANESSVIDAKTKTTKTSQVATSTRVNAEKAEQALVTKIAKDIEDKKPKSGQYIGCFNETNPNRIFNENLGNNGNTIEGCQKKAKDKNLKNFSLQFSQCWGTNNFVEEKGDKIADTNCDYKIQDGGFGEHTGKPSTGGGWINAVYKT